MGNVTSMISLVLLVYVGLIFCNEEKLGALDVFREKEGFSYSYLETWIPEWKSVGFADNGKSGGFNFILKYYPRNPLVESDAQVEEMECKIVILTAGNQEFNTLLELENNRVEYSRKHGYCYLHFSCENNQVNNR